MIKVIISGLPIFNQKDSNLLTNQYDFGGH